VADDVLRHVKDGHSLAHAIVDTVREALIVLDRDLRVVAASRSFYQTFGANPQDTQGQLFYDLDNGQWNIPALRRFLEEVIPQHRAIEGYEVEHEFPTIGRRTMLLNARQVFEEEHPDSTLLLLAIEDITQRRDAEREKDELLRQKEMLLQEMQHRVANSLQIIASILMLKARTVQSEETRQHLRDAHQRVMSVATVQQQLRASGLGDRIEVGPYLSKLCDSLRNSMIDHSSLHALLLQAATGTVESSQAVGLGFVTTELVINALKHAFPSGYEGEIVVVMGRGGRRIPQADAPAHILGYSCANEGSVRDWLRHSKFNVTQGKNFDRSGSLGPCLVPADQIGTQPLRVITRVNGEVRQDDTSDRMIFPIPYLISYLSTFCSLESGDVILTGTPSGAGARLNPPKYLRPGDVVEVEVPGVGLLRNSVVDDER